MEHVLVYSGTGTQGRPVVDQLVQRGIRTDVLSRNPDTESNGTIVVGDMEDPESLKSANEEVDGVILILPLSNYGKMVAYTKAVVEAAKANGVGKVVMNTSVAGVDEKVGYDSLDLKVEAEQVLKESGLNYSIVRPTIYLDNFTEPMHLQNIHENNMIAYAPPGDMEISWISLRDSAAFTIEALLQGRSNGKTFNVGGPEAIDGNRLADLLGNHLGKEIQYAQIPQEQMKAQLDKMMAPPVGDLVTEFYEWAETERGNLVYDIGKATAQLGVKPETPDAWIKRQNWTPE